MGQSTTSPDISASDAKLKNEYKRSSQSIEAAPPDEGQCFNCTLALYDAEHYDREQQPEEQPWQPNPRDWVIIVCVAIVAMMDAFDSTVLLPALPHMANELQSQLVTVFWANTAYLILSATSFLFVAMLAEVYNYCLIWVLSVGFTTVGTGICSGALDSTVLIIGRGIQGIGGGGALSMCFVMMAVNTPPAIHSRYSCFIMLTRLVGFIAGPIVGGIFVDYANWTWMFYFDFIFCALGLFIIPLLAENGIASHSPPAKLRALDWYGSAMAVAAPTCMVVGLSWGGILHHWDEWQVLMPIALGVAILIALVVYEAKWASNPQFGSRVFRNVPTIATHFGCFCHGFVFFGQLQFFALYFHSTRYFSTALSGVSLFAILGFAIIPTAVVGIILAQESRYSKFITPGGWILTTMTAGCSILFRPDTPTVGWVFLFFAAGLGHGLLLSSYNIQVHSLPKEEGDTFSIQPSIVSVFMRALGMAIAVPVGGVIFLNIFGQALSDADLDRDMIKNVRGYLILMNGVEMSADIRESARYAAMDGLQLVWEVLAGMSAIGGFSSIALWKK